MAKLYRAIVNLATTVSRQQRAPHKLEDVSDLMEWAARHTFPELREEFLTCLADELRVLPKGFDNTSKYAIFSCRSVLSNLNSTKLRRPDSLNVMMDGTFKIDYGD